jgi:hypothetical protein
MRHFFCAAALPLRFVLLSILVVMLSSCQETEILKAEVKETQQKVTNLQQELQNMDVKMADYRKAIPPYAGQGEIGAKRYAVELAKELAAIETQILEAKQSMQVSQVSLEKAQAELEAVKSRDPRQVK